MSGGSWDYVYRSIQETAERLQGYACPLRRALGNRLFLISEALHAIEWVDSYDYGAGEEIDPIKKALGERWREEQGVEILREAKAALEKLSAAISEHEINYKGSEVLGSA